MIEVAPIGTVESTRTEPTDDGWDVVQSSVVLDAGRFTPEALKGLETFSHAEIIFWMHGANEGAEKRRPRGNPAWPETGIFAQRGKDRPNRIGTSVCRILKIDGLRLTLEGLDAIHGTPVLDIKPWVREFGPRGVTRQPTWATEIMSKYWR
ncbi:MAG: SAM-dependent methyltransferase [Bdellovibrionia bacterium]